MKVAYVCANDMKSKVQKIIETEPPGIVKISFVRKGYDFKEGKPYGVEGWVLIFGGDDHEFVKWAEEQLGELVKKLPADKTHHIADAIKKEQDAASEGFGAIFG